MRRERLELGLELLCCQRDSRHRFTVRDVEVEPPQRKARADVHRLALLSAEAPAGLYLDVLGARLELLDEGAVVCELFWCQVA